MEKTDKCRTTDKMNTSEQNTCFAQGKSAILHLLSYKKIRIEKALILLERHLLDET